MTNIEVDEFWLTEASESVKNLSDLINSYKEIINNPAVLNILMHVTESTDYIEECIDKAKNEKKTD